MKRLFKIPTIVILLLGAAIYLPSCKKEATLPNVTTIPVSNITQTTAVTGGTSRSYAVGFSIGSKGYLGTGSLLKDFWEWDQATNVWTQKANFGGPARNGAIGVSIGNKGYLGTGINGNGQPYAFEDLREYDPNLK